MLNKQGEHISKSQLKTCVLLTCIILIVYMFALQLSYSSNINFEIINSNHGLSSDEVNFTLQDSDGFLWFCTNNGINLFDGYSMQLFKPGYSIDDKFTILDVTIACEDNYGNIWFGSNDNGINIYNKQTEEVTAIDLSNQCSNVIKDLIHDSQGRVWIATTNGLAVFNSKDKSLLKIYKRSEADRPIQNNYINCVFEDSKQRIWIGSWGNGIELYYDNIDAFKGIPSNNAEHNINRHKIWSLFEDNKGVLWAGTWGDGLYALEFKDKRFNVLREFSQEVEKNNSLTSNIILSIAQDNTKNYWIGTANGLNIIENPFDNNVTVKKYMNSVESQKGISHNQVNHLFKDQSGILWISTEGGGINKVDQASKQFQHFTIPKINNEISTQKVRSFFKDNDQNLYIGSGGLGFGLYDLEKKTFKHYSEIQMFRNLNLNITNVQCFLLDNDENLWIGTLYNGLIVYNLRTHQYTKFDHSNKMFDRRTINSLVLDSLGRVWVGTFRGLFMFTKKNNDYKITKYRLRFKDSTVTSDNHVSSLLIDSENKLWVGTAKSGLNKSYEPTTHKKRLTFKRHLANRNSTSSIASNNINSIFEDSKKRIWISTGNGLCLFDKTNETFTALRRKMDTREYAAIDIMEDSGGNLWQSTNKGITRVKFNSLNDYQFTNFTVEDGLQGNTFIRGAKYKDSDGNVYFGGHYGFNSFNPEEIKQNKFIPSAAITKVKILNKPVKYATGDVFTLTHKDTYFAIEFTALSFSHPKKNKFAFMLENFDENWRYTDAMNRSANYSNLDPGEYTFLVKAANNSGVWNDTPLSIPIIIKPAPYKTWWAISLYILVILSIIWLIFKSLLDKVKIQQALQIESIERAKSEKLNQFKLRFFTNISHELLTPLSIILCLIDQKQGKSIEKEGMVIMKRNINRLRHLINQLLEFRKVETGNLKLLVKHGSISEYIEKLADNFKPLSKRKDIEFQVNIPTNITGWFDNDKLDKIIHNLLSNAFKYTQNNGSINLLVKEKNIREKRHIELTVSDTGKGIPQSKLPDIFDRFYQLNENTENNLGAGIGLALTKNLVNLHYGEINVESKENKGTSFTVTIPIEKNSFPKNQILEGKPISDPRKELIEEDVQVEPIEITNEFIKPDQANHILVVEDNDDLRHLIKDSLNELYHVTAAKDGLEGFKVAENNNFDIIISDVMMPRMNGIELCQKIKSTFETSHIPVILLTARVTEDNRVEGYEAGADSYITKPVNLKTLKTRIHSLVRQREQLRERYKVNNFNLKIEETKLTSLDEKFMGQVKEIIEKNISNTELSVKSLCSEIGVSNSVLYRKLTSLSGLTPNELIKSIRLEKAAQLIRQKAMPIADVAYETGFNDPSYFGACFKKEFGLSPLQFAKNHGSQN